MTKRVLSFVLALLMVVGMLPARVRAADTLEDAMAEVNIYAKDQKLNWLTMNGSVKEQEYTYYNYRSAQTGETKEIPAYCVDPRLYGVPALTSEGTPIKYTAESTVNDPKICGIISNGYPHMGLDTLGLQTKEEAYYATKTALWCYLLGNWTISGLGVNPNLSGADKQAAQRVLTATKAIYQRGMYWDELYSPKLTATADTSKATPVTINGMEYYQQVFTIDSNTWSLTPIHVSLVEGAPAGAVVMNMDGDEISQIILSTERTAGAGYQTKVKVVYPKSAIEGETGTCQLKLDATVVEYKIYYAKTLETDKYGNIQHYMLDTDPSTPISTTAISSYSSDPDTPDDPHDPPPDPEDSTLTIYKYEAGTRKPLAGAIFDVWYPNGNKYGSFATDETGTISLPINIFGNYTVTERIPPKYHLLPEISTQHVTVTATTPGVLTFWNAPFGNLRVHKISNTGDNLEGVSITIKNLETGETQTGKTGAGGVIEFTELKPGGYEVKETAGIKGYVLDVEATKTATVVTGETSEVTFVNKEKPGLKIVKFDRKTLKTMPDISFEIWRDGESLGTYTTDQMGEIVMPDLEPGTYLIKEVQSDDGHIADPTPQQVELHAGDGVKQVLFYNDQKPGMRLIKVDSENLSKVIPNVKFEIKSVAGDYGPAEFTTDANGEIDLSELPVGAYVVTELECPDHYLIDNASRIIQLDGNETARFVFTNTPKPSIEVIKFDPNTGKYLAGATFRIAKIEDGSHYLDRVTDTQGRIIIDDLEPGIYSVQETAAPSGYILNDTEYHVELFPGKTSELVVNNEKKPDLKIIKTDAISGKPISGATFTVRKVDSSTLITETTDANGEIFLGEMDPGVYEITEQSVPDAYLLDPRPQKITLTPDKLGVVQFQNYPKPTLTVKKIDSATGKPVEGARFHFIYGSNHTFTGEINDLGEFYTDANGIIKLEKLKDGWYQATEVEAPAGYRIKDSGIQECYIAAGRDKVLTFENIPLSTILIQKMDEETGKPLSGAWFRMKYLNSMTSMDGTTIGEWPTDDKGQIEVNGLDEGTYIIDEISAPAGYVMNAANTRTVYLSGENQDFVTITYGNQKMGSLLIVKKDALTGAPLANVEFFVTDSDGAVVGNGNGKFTTDYAGSILINNLEPGKTVVAKETRTVSGYVLDDAPQTVKIKANETVTLEFRNAPKGTLIVQKIDSATGEPLTGAEFKITTADGELTADNEGLTSSNGIYQADRNGQVVLEKLTPGAYVVTETKAPDGYVLEAQPQTVVVNAGDTQTLTFGNPPKGSLTIHKLDSLTGKPLEGCVFLITYADGTVVDDGKLSSNGLYVTDKNGQIILSGITGTLIVTEEKTIPGYEIDPETRSQTVVVNPDDAQALTFYNRPKGTLIVQKYDKATGLPLSGAEFKITTASGELLADNEGLTSTNGLYVTDENGQIILSKLSAATYIVTETEAPEGYQLDPTPQTVVVNTTDTQTLIFRNEPLATLTIIKRDVDTKELLAGAAFTVKDGAGNLIGEVKQYVTGEDGTVTLTGLTPNTTAVISEEVPPAGYWNGSDLQTVMLRSGTVNSVTFENRKLGTLIIRKFIEGTDNEPLKGVAFRVTAGDGSEIGSDGGVYYTDAKGEIVLRDIQPDIIVKAREIKTVDGFVLDGTPQDVKIIGGQTQQLTFWNKRQGALTIRKLDSATQKPLEGVTFKITTATGEFVPDKNGKISSNGLYKTDAAGEIVLTGVTGTLVVTEVATIPGYTIHEESRSQTIVVNPDDTQELTFYNDPTQTLTLQKYKAGTTTPIAGVAFKITSSDGTVLGSSNGEFVTDRSGQIVLSGLTPGITVTAQEIRTVSGYVLDATPQSILIKSGEAQTLNFYNQRKGGLIIEKRDSVTKEPLAGAEFKITTIDGAFVDDNEGQTSTKGVYRTDSNGQIVLTNILPNTYVVRETKAPDGYILDSEEQSVKVNANDTQTLTFTNTAMQSVVIQKFIDGTNTGLPGVTFLVTDASGAPVGSSNGEHVTDENGRIVLTGLTPGTVLTVREVKTVKGYTLNGAPQTIVVGTGAASQNTPSNGTVTPGTGNTLTFYDDPLSVLIIQKYVEGTTTPIKDVRFLVTDNRGAPVGTTDGEYVTDEHGQIVLKDLEPGTVITAKEVRAADGYVSNSTPKSITIQSGDVQTLTFYNSPTGTLILVKRDRATDKPLPGAKFQITDSTGAYVGNDGGKQTSNGEYITGEDGTIRITGLQPCALVIREVKAPDGYTLNTQPLTVEIKASDTQTVNFYNDATQALTIQKYVTRTTNPIQGVTFLVTDSSGAAVGPNNGEYTTDRNGRIVLTGLVPGTTITAKEVKTASGYVLDTTPQSILIKQGEAQTLTFFNTAEGGLELIKVDATDKTKRLANTTFEIRRMDGGLVDTVTTDKSGRVHVDLDAGDYYLVETEAAEGYKLDATPTYFTVTDGKTTTVTVTNKAVSGILIHKTDAATGKGLYGVTFLLYDSKNNPVGQYTTDNQGYARIEGIDAGRYQLRELENKGYVPDTQMKTVEVKSGETTLIEWKNIPITAQIQITKKSADYNPTNGLAAGTLLEGAVFEIYDKANNLVDTIQSNNRGLAVSKQLPLGRYTIKEVKAPANYGVNENELTAYLEHEGQIVRFEVSDKSLTTGVNIAKTGPKEVMAGQIARYQFSGIANSSNIRLDSFYWRDTLPAEVRLDKVVTGTYNFPGTYKITYRVNGGEPRTLADNLSTSRNYTLSASAVALGLASNERVTEIMFVFGQAPGGFAQVEAPQIYCTVVSSTTSTSFVNVADVGGVYNGQWVQGVSRWVTTIYKKSTPLPRTGY